MKLSSTDDPLELISLKMCQIVQNMIYSAYQEQDFVKARRNGLELISIVQDELDSYPK
jgi:hypothetical protein